MCNQNTIIKLSIYIYIDIKGTIESINETRRDCNENPPFPRYHS